MALSKEIARRLKEFAESLTPVESQEEYAESPYSERSEGATPLGGDYSIAFFYDENHNPCEKGKAKFVNTVIYDKGGKRVNEVYGRLG